MTRIFLKELLAVAQECTLNAEDSHYLSSVLRMREGEVLDVVDGSGRVYNASVKDLSKNACVLFIDSEQHGSHEPGVHVTLFQSVSKGERMDLTIQKSVELGVHKIVPVMSERCVVRLDGRKDKSDRWQKIALEAARQSGRDIVPVVTEPVKFADAVKNSGSGLKLIPWEEAKGVTLKEVLAGRNGIENEIAVFIGPEGGFTAAEADMARSNDIIPVTLGPRILRTETAGPAVLAMIMYEAEL